MKQMVQKNRTSQRVLRGFIAVLVLISFVISPVSAASKNLAEKSYTDTIGLTDGGWVSCRTHIKGTLTYKDSGQTRKFTKEDYFMFATSNNDKTLTKRIRVSLGPLVLHAGGKVHKCYAASGNYPYYADPKWITHKRVVSKTKASGKLKGKSYATLGFSYTGDGLVNHPSHQGKWKKIAY